MQPSKWDQGKAHIQQGCDKHEAGNKHAAAQLYGRGIQLLIDHVRMMPASSRKTEKQAQIDSYLSLLADLTPDKDQFAAAASSSSAQHHTMKQQHRKSAQQSKNVNRIKPKSQAQRPQPAPQRACNKHDAELYERIEQEIISSDPHVSFADVVGLENVKQALLEAVILPAQRPDIFTGPRRPPRGLLLFGPPGNGKTFIAKALASECNATFFCISASSLTSRYVGEGEKLVRALFECARQHAPSIIFIDEIDSLLSTRGKDEQESSRRMKTEFLIQFDGVQSGADDDDARILLVGATNLPWELDDAALRRFPKRILVNRPDGKQRTFLINKLLYANGSKSKAKKSKAALSVKLCDKEIAEIANSTNGYSASDIKNLVSDAAMGPVRDVGMDILQAQQIPPVTVVHFREALQNIKPSTTKQAQQQFVAWDQQFGTKLNVKHFKSKQNNAFHMNDPHGNSNSSTSHNNNNQNVAQQKEIQTQQSSWWSIF